VTVIIVRNVSYR